MIRVALIERAPIQGVDALQLRLRRIPTPRLSARRALAWPGDLLVLHSIPYLRFQDAVEDGRTIRRLERHTRPLGRLRGPARIDVPEGVRTGFLLALAGAQARLPLHFDLPASARAKARKAGLRVVAREPNELEPGGLGVVRAPLDPWIERARHAGEVVLIADPPLARQLADLVAEPASSRWTPTA